MTFATLLVALAAIPALAAEAPETPPSPLGPTDETGPRLPEPSSAERKGTAEQLLAAFPQLPVMLEADPARYLSDVTVLDVASESVATVSDEGNGILLEAGIPVRTENEQGDLAKVDLDLLPRGSTGFEPANPLIDLHIPTDADQPVAIGSDGLSISSAGVSTESGAQLVRGEDVFFPDVYEDTDLLVAPRASGVELLDQLRSSRSPEVLRFVLGLPDGAVLRTNGAGGAEIVREDAVLAVVPPLKAFDADDIPVPVEVEVEGATIVARLAHRDEDFAYPILLDPSVEAIGENYEGAWYWGADTRAIDTPGVWEYSTNDPTERWILHSTTCLRAELCSPSGRGLFISSVNGTLPANVYGEWFYTVPGATTFIPSLFPAPSAAFNPFWRQNHNCFWESYRVPFDYDGAFENSAWTYFETDRAQWSGFAAVFTRAKGIAFGLSTGGGINIPCWRNIMVGGVAVRLDDPEPPTLNAVVGAPSGWVSESTSFTIAAFAEDPGLGVRNVTLSGSFPTIPFTPVQNECPGTKTHRCPPSVAAQLTRTGTSFDEGVQSLQFSAYDPTGKTSNTIAKQIKVDLSPPTVNLSGQLALATQESGSKEVPPGDGDELRLPVYNLRIKATDGSTASPAQERSGVKDIQVFLDSSNQPEPVPWTPQSPLSSREMNQVYTLKLAGLSPGAHTLRVVAIDQVNHREERKIEFEYVPATGLKDEYVMERFPLPDGVDHEGEEVSHGPELAVNLMNGNLVYHERDFEVEGFAADLEVERFYNSQLPDSENTEWGDGWTLAQTPELEPIDAGGSPASDAAVLLDSSGAIDGEVALPEAGQTRFDPALQATLTAQIGGGYELRDETGGAAGEIAFDPSGHTEELRTGELTGVEYEYKRGVLTEIAVDDPSSTTEPPKPPASAPAFAIPQYVSAFGSLGAGNGQLNGSADVDFDASGNLWALDQRNDRVVRFNRQGSYLSHFSTKGPGGQFFNPTALEVDAEGDIWVLDGKAMEFNQKGEFLRQFGSFGETPGLLAEPAGLAIDAKGNLLISDFWNGNVQKFSPTGQFLKVIAFRGAGGLGEPAGVGVGPDGNVWVADVRESRVLAFNEAGQFLRRFGSPGSGEGQFTRPISVTVDDDGFVWVGDPSGDRVEVFDETGAFLGQFGAPGSGEGEFELTYPMDVAIDPDGNVWIADTSNNRVQKWRIPSRGAVAEPAPVDDDPAVEIETSAGLVTSLEGEEAGSYAYAHNGELLTSVGGPQGTTTYEYDAANRLTKVTLANGTIGSIAYRPSDGRVKSVTVDPAGTPSSKTTNFEYSDEPRRTTVMPPAEPVRTYEVGFDGSVLRWSNAVQPPKFASISGNLYSERETLAAISVGDLNLVVEGRSPEGVDSIRVVADGNILVDEKTCQQDPGAAGVECESVTNEWVTGTGDLAPGILHLEVLLTDRLGATAGERFWVNIPYTPPPQPGAPPAPQFSEVLQYREEQGLDLDLNPVSDELALNDRIFNLISAWRNPQTPLGEIARSSWERWTSPLRPVDVAELEYRRRYIDHDLPLIESWARANAAGTFASVYVDHRAGGLMRVGFTAGGDGAIASLKHQVGLSAPERLAAFPTTPVHSLAALEAVENQVSSVTPSLPAGLVTSIGLDPVSNRVVVGATDVSRANTLLKDLLGQSAPIEAVLGSAPVETGRKKTSGPVLAGDYIFGRGTCSAGYGAFRNAGGNALEFYLLTAAHCAHVGDTVTRENVAGKSTPIGRVARSGRDPSLPRLTADGEAVRTVSSELSPRKINAIEESPIPVKSIAPIPIIQRQRLCHSGFREDKVLCGNITKVFRSTGGQGAGGREEFFTCFSANIRLGDSGGPVWIEGTGTAVGLATGALGLLKDETYANTCAITLIPRKDWPAGAAILTNSSMAGLQLHLRTHVP